MSKADGYSRPNGTIAIGLWNSVGFKVLEEHKEDKRLEVSSKQTINIRLGKDAIANPFNNKPEPIVQPTNRRCDKSVAIILQQGTSLEDREPFKQQDKWAQI